MVRLLSSKQLLHLQPAPTTWRTLLEPTFSRQVTRDFTLQNYRGISILVVTLRNVNGHRSLRSIC